MEWVVYFLRQIKARVMEEKLEFVAAADVCLTWAVLLASRAENFIIMLYLRKLQGMPMAEMVKLLLTSGFHEERIQCTTDLDPEIARLTEVGVEIIRIATGVAVRLFLIDAQSKKTRVIKVLECCWQLKLSTWSVQIEVAEIAAIWRARGGFSTYPAGNTITITIIVIIILPFLSSY